MDLLPFQEAASTQIANRFGDYIVDPLMIDMKRRLPFFQMLVSITGSGKTLMLADAVSQMRTHVPREPVVLWLSKGRVVVGQTYANLAAGKYSANIPNFLVKPLLELAPSHIDDAATPLLLIATVGKFARKDEEGNDRKIFEAQLDLADESLWNVLKNRRLPTGERRPLIVIYDEGQNLSDLQTDRLLELGPDALISASATPSVPAAMEMVIARLRGERGWTKDDFRTTVSSPAVVKSGLVKQRISLGGYVTPMETAVDALLADMKEAQAAAAELSEPFRPKAIYVSTTNTVDGASIAEDTDRSFDERRARPIVIWRHLVASGVDPAKIAVYCNLTLGKKTPPPPSFNLFSGGDRDYDRFADGRFEHIIFNLGLQEGWDDPACGFAYIDKEMASARQVTQVVGRTLRQPGAEHYADPVLNTAHFYIRSDEKGVFEGILSDLQVHLADEHPAIELTVRPTNQRAGGFRAPPPLAAEVGANHLHQLRSGPRAHPAGRERADRLLLRRFQHRRARRSHAGAPGDRRPGQLDLRMDRGRPQQPRDGPVDLPPRTPAAFPWRAEEERWTDQPGGHRGPPVRRVDRDQQRGRDTRPRSCHQGRGRVRAEFAALPSRDRSALRGRSYRTQPGKIRKLLERAPSSI